MTDTDLLGRDDAADRLNPGMVAGSGGLVPFGRRRVIHLLLAVVLLASLSLKLHHLGHAGLTPMDEVFHAVVARNLMRHPLTPTLVDRPFLRYEATDWQSTHVWLHKPPVALWQIAASFAVLGVNALAVRLPSALLSTAAAGLTYAIGAELLTPTAGLVAAGLQAFNPFILLLVHGYQFGDHVDVALLFWTELAVYALARRLRTGRRSDLLWCGIAQGLAFLSKTYPALIVTGLAAVAWAVPAWRLARPPRAPLRLRSVGLLVAVTAATVAPWLAWTAVRFPVEFRHENLQILSHLDQDVEGWGGPWDRVVFHYLVTAFGTFYPAVIAAAALLAGRAVVHRSTAAGPLGTWVVLAWAAGAIVPHLLATSKTPSATLVGWPALWLLVGQLVALALAGDVWPLGTWATAMVLAATLLGRAAIPRPAGSIVPAPGTGLAQHGWVLWQAAAAVVGGGVVQAVTRRLKVRSAKLFTDGLIVIAAMAMLWLAISWGPRDTPRGPVPSAWAVTQLDAERPAFTALGVFAQRLPTNAALVVDERSMLECQLVAFAADHTCYPLGRHTWRQAAAALVAAGALPFFVSPDPQPLPAVCVDPGSHRTLYACTPAALRAGRAAALP